MMLYLIPLLLLAAASALMPADTHAQRTPAFYNYPHNHLDWYTIESEHFLVHFQEGSSRPAQVASRIAEEIYGPITELYGHEPEHKISILIIDRLDYSNGAAFFYDNKIEIWLPALDTPLRGTHNWLRNVITHEFAHIVQLQASMKKSRRHPASYVQWLSYEDVRRPDVLYGFPNGIITYPLAGISMPAWLAEGTAQYMREEIYYDDWDSHRDMLLRTRMLDSTWLSLEKMGTFTSKTSLERELVYNQGFSFTRYLADRFGEQAVADITRAFSRRGVYDVRKAIRQATGIDGREVFDDWIAELSEQYTLFAEGRERNPSNRTWVEPFGFFNFHPTWHPDGDRITYLSNRFRDGAMVSLYTVDSKKLVDADSLVDADGAQNAANIHAPHEMGGTHSIAVGPDHARSSRPAPIRSNRTGHSASARAAHSLNSSAGHPGHPHECHLDSAPLRRLETAFAYAPDGSRIAYSRARINRYGENYRDLYIFDPESGNSKRLTHSQRLQDPAWHPGGNYLATGKIEDGSINLFLYDLERDSLIRVTDFRHGEQLYRPVWHPDGTALYTAYADTAHRGIYLITLEDGLINADAAGGGNGAPTGTESNGIPASAATSAHSVTANNAGQTRTGSGTRRFTMTPVLVDAAVDYRDPAVSSDGQWLYFSADHSGVFNLYRKSLADGSVQQLTNLVGGAFMPHPHPDPVKEKVLYSEFTSGGYKIALLDLTGEDFAGIEIASAQPAQNRLITRQPTRSKASNQSATGTRNIYRLNRFDDSDIEPFSDHVTAVADTGIYRFQLPTRGSSYERQFYTYDDQFTSFQFYPVIRFDNYSRLKGSNSVLLRDGRIGDLGSNLWRDSKVGLYFASREMRERLSIFGGALFGPGSRPSDGISNFFRPGRLVNLDRDLFFEVEYAGLPFIKRHWSPTVSVAFFNIRRNVEDGLQIEEFPCTACLPDTTGVDIAYNMWQLEVNLISKINRWSLIELGYYYSPYRVSTSSFFSREFRQEVPGSTSRYYVGSTWTTAWIFDLSLPYRHGDIAPMGWRGQLRYSYEPSELLDSYDIRDGTLVPVYNTFDNHSVEADVRVGFRLRSQRFNLRSRFFTYFDGPDEFFYLDYIGGMIGMRSYPFFALGGTTTAYSTLSWFLPLKTDIYRQMSRLTVDKVFLRLFAEAGNGWGGPLDIGNDLKTGVGAELRIGMNSYYFFPTSFFISGAYGFNSYDLQLPDAFITETPTGRVTYGNQILINFGLLFDFEF
jgi:Tol biopolymer transport system component